MKTEQLAVVQGWADTRGALRRWNARPAAVLRPWALASLAVGVLLLAATWAIATLSTPDPSGAEFPGVTYRALARGLRVEEVPITFRDRSAGDSKMSARIALEAIWLVPALRIARRRDGLPEAPGSGEPGTLPIPEA